MNIKAFVYVEVQASAHLGEFPWKETNEEMKKQPGLVNKTWLSGADNNSVGGFYAFDSMESAKSYATIFMPKKCKEMNVGLTTRIFDAVVAEEASRDMGSPFFV